MVGAAFLSVLGVLWVWDCCVDSEGYAIQNTWSKNVLLCHYGHLTGHSAPMWLSGHKPEDVPRSLCCQVWVNSQSQVLWQETVYLVYLSAGPRQDPARCNKKDNWSLRHSDSWTLTAWVSSSWSPTLLSFPTRPPHLRLGQIENNIFIVSDGEELIIEKNNFDCVES